MRGIPLSVHGVIEMFAAPAIMVTPFVLGFGPAATIVSVLLGVVLFGQALQSGGPGRTVSLTAHASFDYTLGLAAVLSGLAIGAATGEWNATSFLVGIGAALVMLTASTRFSVARST